MNYFNDNRDQQDELLSKKLKIVNKKIKKLENEREEIFANMFCLFDKNIQEEFKGKCFACTYHGFEDGYGETCKADCIMYYGIDGDGCEHWIYDGETTP